MIDDMKTWTMIAATLLAVAGLVFAAYQLDACDARACASRGGQRRCHSSYYSGTDGKGRPTYGTITDCRCLAPDGKELP